MILFIAFLIILAMLSTKISAKAGLPNERKFTAASKTAF